MTISYRTPGRGEWRKIDALFRTSFCDTFAHLYADSDLQTFLASFTADGWTRELADPQYAFQIAEDGETAIGYCKLGPTQLPVTASGASIELRQLYILKSWHGRGIAEHLMGWALETAGAMGAGEMFLTVYTDNHRARRFYERHGFEYIGPYTYMVGNHADEDIIMRLQL